MGARGGARSGWAGAAAAVFALTLAIAAPVLGGETAPGPEVAQARQILEATGITGGLVVHVGCGDGKLTAALGASDGFLVQGLDADAANVAKARAHIRTLGRYGRVAVDRLTGKRLPFIDNLANLVVASVKGQVSSEEIARVLAPRGRALISSGSSLDTRHLTLATRSPAGLSGWALFTKPVPQEIDEWTHYLHSPSNNPVANDTVVAPPRRLQWVGSPRYARHHDRMSSVSAVVTAGGRVFTIFDEASRISVLVAPQWRLIARDAFNGTILWKRPIATWHTHLQGLKSGPASLPRRLVAVGDPSTGSGRGRIYVTLGIEAPLSALDAMTGKTLRTYDDTKPTREVLVSDGILFLVVGSPAAPLKPVQGRPKSKGWWDEGPRRLMAVRADTGETLWSADKWVVPLTLAVEGQRVLFYDGQSVVCLGAQDGKQQWRSKPLPRGKSFPSHYAPTLVVHDGVVIFAGGETAAAKARTWYTEGEDTMTALSAKTGEVLWNGYHPPSGYASPEDVFIADGMVWTGESTSGRAVGVFTGRDLRTGEVKSEFPPDVDTYWFHHRCHRGKATVNYLLTSRAGIEFIDFRKKHWITNHWVRGACLYGIMPANGLIYAPQHPCACYLESKLSGFNALAGGKRLQVPGSGLRAERLERGPAFAAGPEPVTRNLEPSDWPTYRHHASRSGRTKTAVPATLKTAWATPIGGRLSSLVAAEGKVFVASIDDHSVHAIDAASGKEAWSYTAGGRVDSPPTIHQGRVLFGSADGWVYCLRASDGALAWRFRAAPTDERAPSFEQLESVWPVHGSVLVRDGVVWAVAGRSMFLDGGLRLCRLDPASGKLISETVLDDREAATGKSIQDFVSWLNMPVAAPDVLSSQGGLVYMRSQPFKPDGTRLPLEAMPRGANADAGAPPATQRRDRAHLFSPTGFLDDSWWHRTYWLYGSLFVSGWCGYYRAGKTAPAGRILVFDEEKVYGFGRKPLYFRWTTPIEHHLFAASKTAVPVAPTKAPAKKRRQPAPQIPRLWAQDVPLMARAMVLAGDTIFIAGPPDLVDEQQASRRLREPEVQQALADHADALAGRKGALLWAVSVANGTKLAELKLDASPVFDGMIAANGRLYLATTAGRVLCLGPAR